MLNDIEYWFAEIARTAEQLVDDQADPLTPDQAEDLRLIYKIAAEYQPRLFSFLAELLQEKSPYEAVSRMSTEWRTPLTSIRGHCELLLIDFRGPLSTNQRRNIEQIKTHAESLWDWCNIGNPYLGNDE